MKPVTKFIRLDKQIVDRGLVSTIQRAQELILNGAVRVNGAVITAAHCPINDDHVIEISGIDCPWVSPDALKLFEALETQKIDVRGRIAVDIGAGLGGFCDVLLQKSIRKVFAIEKETNLLHPSLSLNPRIKNLHRTDAKSVTTAQIDEDFDLIVADLPVENFIETVVPVARLAQGSYDLLVFVSDKKAGKELEKTLRLELGCLVKKVSDSFQKSLGEKGSYLMWLQKK